MQNVSDYSAVVNHPGNVVSCQAATTCSLATMVCACWSPTTWTCQMLGKATATQTNKALNNFANKHYHNILAEFSVFSSNLTC